MAGAGKCAYGRVNEWVRQPWRGGRLESGFEGGGKEALWRQRHNPNVTQGGRINNQNVKKVRLGSKNKRRDKI